MGMAELQKNFVTKIEGWADLASGHSLLYSSVAKLYPALCYRLDCSTPSFLCFTISRSSLKLISIESVMPSNHLILCHSLLILPSIFPSSRVSSTQTLHLRWPKYQRYGFSISPSNEYSGLISFRIDWFDLLAVQEAGLAKILSPFFNFLRTKVNVWSARPIKA